MHSDAFDVIPYDDIKGEWTKLGAGSFGNVYKGVYLGIDVAIKEVLPSKEYDVAKYFEREWRLMKECRHPNICLFIGLSRAPPPDNRIFIVSEFIENGNVRMYIHDKSKQFPWRLRMSFATDVARALAYLHARKCIHRDLKGENLLVTSNGRLKITDFGFARIAARNEEESKRLTFCGTDSYMSPEILLGDEFDLPTDIFSLGIIFCEIAARKLADDTHFKRHPPSFGLDPEELHKLASPDCPAEFLALCVDCLATDPSARPTTRDILERLRLIEAQVIARPSEGEDLHVGSIKFLTGGKRPAAGPRIPSFGMGVGKEIRNGGAAPDESDDELMEAVEGLSSVGISSDWSDGSNAHEPLLEDATTSSKFSEYSTTVIRSHPSQQPTTTQPPSLSSSILTIRPSPDLNATPDPIPPVIPSSPSPASPKSPPPTRPLPDSPEPPIDLLGTSSIFSIASLDSYHTAPGSSFISSALATEGGSTIRSIHGNYSAPLVHRFTLLKPGAKPKRNSGSGSVSPNRGNGEATGWNPLELIFSSGLLVSKCDVCNKRLGWKPVLECDDCGLRSHVKCGEIAPLDCGIRPSRPDLHAVSPLSRVKQSASNASMAAKSKSGSPART
ncbi:RasGEF domain-containing serine/threonine-protein kinase X [Hypsizygus marmoreus]|uniref:RasGEF domain-containing serine/threonine-protein kinase X n=1 Tax=Hypsizygus marmoreus TaxID=39966 RepID=A0A369JGE1_HYPMA|nr:RasGEF domain-containing serine/threonine-protein kinase X [Hypsizygus marmoreus]